MILQTKAKARFLSRLRLEKRAVTTPTLEGGESRWLALSRRAETAGRERRWLSAMAVAGVTVCAAACSSQTPEISESDEPKTPLAIFEAQTELYEALFEDPPDFDAAADRMSSGCREVSADPAEVVAEVYAEVEIAQSLGLELESLLPGFSQVRYKIDDDRADADDGSSWEYEDGRWLSTDC